MSEENLANLRRGHEAFSRGDISEMFDLATPDVEWGATGAFPGVEGLYRGPESIEQWVDIIRSEWEEFEVTLDEILRVKTRCWWYASCFEDVVAAAMPR
jgi:ketosteroid isomerase-like protein